MDYIILSVFSEPQWVSTLKNATPEELRADIVETIERLKINGETMGELLVFQTVGESTSIKF